jgi:hypothetical protein
MPNRFRPVIEPATVSCAPRNVIGIGAGSGSPVPGPRARSGRPAPAPSRSTVSGAGVAPAVAQLSATALTSSPDVELRRRIELAGSAVDAMLADVTSPRSPGS